METAAVPGKRITDHQVNNYKSLRRSLTQEVSAAKSGISISSARRIERAGALPSQRPARRWRTRADPFGDVWDTDIEPMLEAAPSLMAITVLEELQRRHPGRFAHGQLRTLQRRLRQWRAEHGPERELYFVQEHPLGRLGLSDFTVCNELGVHIGGAPLAHRLYQFAFAYSGWRHAQLVLGGESFQALSEGLQAALWAAGGVPAEHRTDSLSAAFNNLAEHEQLTARYAQLCQDYGMRASRNNPGQSHENGAIEARQGSLKRALEQALLLRGSRHFEDLAAYEHFIAEVVRQLNARCQRAWQHERACLQPLPRRRSIDYEELRVRVSKYGVFTAKGVLYSVPSRLVGQQLVVRLYARHIEAWLGAARVFECERLRVSAQQRHPRRIDWRHMLPSLKRKPGALARWAWRDALFPRSEYARMWQQLIEELPEHAACHTMVALLDLAHQAGAVNELALELARLLQAGELPDIDALRQRLAPRPLDIPQVHVVLPAPAIYDQLLQVRA